MDNTTTPSMDAVVSDIEDVATSVENLGTEISDTAQALEDVTAAVEDVATDEMYYGDEYMPTETEYYTGEESDMMYDSGYGMEMGTPTQEVDPAAMAAAAGFGLVMFVIWFAVVALMIVSLWKIFKKAGQPGWASIVPIYNIVVWLQIVQKPIWWIVLLFIPIVNIVVMIMMYHALSKAFGKGVGYTLGMLFLGIIFFPMLAFGSSTYVLTSSIVPSPTQTSPTEPTPTV